MSRLTSSVLDAKSLSFDDIPELPVANVPVFAREPSALDDDAAAPSAAAAPRVDPGGVAIDDAADAVLLLGREPAGWPTASARNALAPDSEDERGVPGHSIDLVDGVLGGWLQFAQPALDAVPSAPGPSTVPGPNSSGIEVIDLEFAAKGGGGGKPGGGGTDPSVLKNYYSGSTLVGGTNPGPADPGYDIWIEFKGTSWTKVLQDAFVQAADYFTTVITDDIGGGGSYRGKLIDDLYITAELTTIDGAGGVLGQAGPSAVWSANQLTAAGQMQFDSADAQLYLEKGLWLDIVTHEMMHVLGFGTLWEYGDHNLVDNDFGYIGVHGLTAYRATVAPSAAVIPVEDDGGPGTAGGHWDDQALLNELMTGYINDDGDAKTTNDNYLSSFSVMSLQDLGYNVDEDYALFAPT